MRRTIYDYFFLLLLGLGLYGVLLILSPFSGALLAAFLCTILFWPLYQTLRGWFPKRSATFRAALATLIVILLFLVPLILLGWIFYLESESLTLVFKQGNDTLSQWRDGGLVKPGTLIGHIGTFSKHAFGINSIRFRTLIVNHINQAMNYITTTASTLAEDVIQMVFNLFVMLFALFFMFRDGEWLSHYIFNLIPLREENKERMAKRIRDTLIGVVRGWLLTSLVQGLVAMLGYWIIQARGVVLLGTLTAAMGLIPAVGTLGVTIPLAVYYFSKGALFQGAFILFWGTVVVVGLMDTILRSYLIGKKAEIPLFILFFALLGGTEVWGAKGIILGPLLVAVIPVFLDIYRSRYLRRSNVIPATGPDEFNERQTGETAVQLSA